MILAAADAAKGGPPPPELVWAWRSEKWGLPNGRGWLNEPAGLVDRMSQALSVYSAAMLYETRKPGHEGEWARSHPEEWKVIQAIGELRGRTS
jgi:hypothetical protein